MQLQVLAGKCGQSPDYGVLVTTPFTPPRGSRWTNLPQLQATLQTIRCELEDPSIYQQSVQLVRKHSPSPESGLHLPHYQTRGNLMMHKISGVCQAKNQAGFLYPVGYD
jgi:hypothetical protein